MTSRMGTAATQPTQPCFPWCKTARPVIFCWSYWRPDSTATRRTISPHFHLIDSIQLAVLQRSETKMLAHASFLEMLHSQGREPAQRWLSEHAHAVGRYGTVNQAQWLD